MNKLLNDLKALAEGKEVSIPFQLCPIIRRVMYGFSGTGNLEQNAATTVKQLEKYENERGETSESQKG